MISTELTLEELREILEWCEGDIPWVPEESPLYRRLKEKFRRESILFTS